MFVAVGGVHHDAATLQVRVNDDERLDPQGKLCASVVTILVVFFLFVYFFLCY